MKAPMKCALNLKYMYIVDVAVVSGSFADTVFIKKYSVDHVYSQPLKLVFVAPITSSLAHRL